MQIQFTKTYNGVESPDNEWVGGTTVRAYDRTTVRLDHHKETNEMESGWMQAVRVAQ